MNENIFIGVLLIAYGLWSDQNRVIEAQQKLLHDVALDNMTLRFYIHEKEVEENA